VSRPPLLGRLLVRLLPPDAREPIAGDLEESWQADPRRSSLGFCLLALRSLAACWRARLPKVADDRVAIRHLPDRLIADLRAAWRQVSRSPGFSLAVIATMGISIGATTAMFTVVHGVLLRALPFERPEQLVRIYTVSESERRADLNLSPANFASIREMSDRLGGVAVYTTGEAILSAPAAPRRVAVVRVSAGFFELFGARPVTGRTFGPAENEPGAAVAIVGEDLARELFGGTAIVVGRSLTVDGVARSIVGVLPRTFAFPDERGLWLPREFDSTYSPSSTAGRSGGWLPAVARLRDGVTLAEARAELALIAARLQAAYPQSNAGVGFTVVPLQDDLIGDGRVPLLLLFGAVALVLVIGCANVAGLLLARATTRREELAIRRALGAPALRIAGQLLAEALLLSAFAGALGLALATWSTRAITGLWPESVPRTDLELDTAVLAFSLLVTVLVGLLVGLSPAVRAARTSAADVLRAGGRTGLAAQQGAALRSTLVVVEIALAVLVATAATLVARSVIALNAVDSGFQTDAVTTFRLDLPALQYPNDDRLRASYQSVTTALQGIAGIESVAMITRLPLTGRLNTSYWFEGDAVTGAGSDRYIEVRAITADYFQTLGIPIIAGRTPGHASPDEHPVVISRAAIPAGIEDPSQLLERRLRLGTRPHPVTIVGIAGDVRHIGLDHGVSPHVYVPLDDAPARVVHVLLRGRDLSSGLAGEVRAHLARLDPSLPAPDLRPMRAVVDESIAGRRTVARLLAGFAAAALGLAALGIFSLFSFTVAQRTREIGIRMALGADTTGVVRMVLRTSLLLTGMGAAAGVGAALVLTRFIQSQLFEVSPHDPVTIAGVVVALALVALTASYVPARRAASIDPLLALRAE
jgi:putative ABC transport system permease protein